MRGEREMERKKHRRGEESETTHLILNGIRIT